MKRMKLLRGTLLFCVSFLLSGCNGGNSNGGSLSSPLTLWSVSSLERIDRNEDSLDTKQKSMNIVMAKNEKEGAQLMLRSSSDINAYDVSVTDLVSSDNRFVISKDDIALFNAKYIDCVGINDKFNNPALPAGSVIPDALLPFDTAVEYKENVLPKDVNQSVYIEVKTSKATQPGVYSGKIKVLADAYTHYVPITVEVINYTIPDNPTMANHFARWGTEHFNSAELSCDEEITTKYFESMLDYRMSSSLPFEGEGGPTKYVELLRKYYNAPGFSSYKFFYEATYSSYNDMLIAYNVPLCKEYLSAVIEASLEDNVNYLDKAFFYFSTFVDEPDSNPNVTWEMVRQISETFKKMLTDLASDLDISLVSNSNYAYYKSTVRQTLIDVPNIIPGGYSIDTLESVGAGDISACTELSHFDSLENREGYKRSGNQQVWWYTCIGPQYPYPNMLMNTYLSGPRLISWMQLYYGIDGFLIWDSINYTSSDNGGTPYINCYDQLTDTMTAVSDGKIFYPGKPYGIDGPISSLRAVSYRDGMEDVEVIQAIYDIYSQYGLSADEALEEIMAKEFQGVITNGSAVDFTSSRKTIMETYQKLNSSTALLFAPSEEGSTSNEKIVSFILPHVNATASVGGVVLEKGADGYYKCVINSSNPSLEIEVTNGNNKTTYTKRLTEEEVSLPGFDDGELHGWSVDNFGEIKVDSGSSLTTGSALSITINGRTNDSYKPSFAIDAKEFTDTSKLSKLSFSLYVPYGVEDSYKMEVVASYGTTYVSNADLGSVYLKKGWNKVDLSIQASVRALEDILEFRFYMPNVLNSSGTPSSMTLLLENPTCSYVKEYDETTINDYGEITISKNEEVIRQGEKKSLIVENDVSNVEVSENGQKYLMLGDFENYNQLAQLRYENNFGTVSLTSDPTYVTHGDSAMKMEIIGRGETLKKLDPIMTIFTSHDYFQKINFSDCDYFEVDFYNAMDYEIPVRFTNTSVYYSQYTTLISFTLKPGHNHIQLNLSEFTNSEFSTLNFIFERGEYYSERRVIYMDNFRAHYKEKN